MTLDEMSPNDVVAEVNGWKITADDVRRRLAVKLGLKAYALKNQPGASARLEKFTESAKAKIAYEMVNSTLVEQYGEERGCVATDKNWERVLGKFLSEYGKSATIESVAASAGVVAADLEWVLRRQAFRNDVFVMYDHSISNIQKEAIIAAHERVKNYNWNVAESNKVQLATCTTLLEKIKNGEDFAKVARTGSEFNEDQGAFWGSFAREELEDESDELTKWAFSAEVGAVGGPFELDNGYAIVKLLAREDGAEVVSFAAESVANVTLARINVRQFEEAVDPEDDEVAEIIFESRRRKAEKALLDELHGKMEIDFPHGDDLFGLSTQKVESARGNAQSKNIQSKTTNGEQTK